MNLKKSLVAAALAAIGSGAFPATAVSAATGERAANSNGVGVCVSQLAIDPSIIGVDRLGEGMSATAGPGTAGSGIPASLDGARNTCGEPPGPGHLR